MAARARLRLRRAPPVEPSTASTHRRGLRGAARRAWRSPRPPPSGFVTLRERPFARSTVRASALRTRRSPSRAPRPRLRRTRACRRSCRRRSARRRAQGDPARGAYAPAPPPRTHHASSPRARRSSAFLDGLAALAAAPRRRLLLRACAAEAPPRAPASGARTRPPPPPAVRRRRQARRARPPRRVRSTLAPRATGRRRRPADDGARRRPRLALALAPARRLFVAMSLSSAAASTSFKQRHLGDGRRYVSGAEQPHPCVCSRRPLGERLAPARRPERWRALASHSARGILGVCAVRATFDRAARCDRKSARAAAPP